MNGLLNFLYQEDPIETQQRQNHGQNINDMRLDYGPRTIPRIPKNNFFTHSFVATTKQHRYSYMPAHSHDFIELNYMVSGQSNQVLNGQTYQLPAGHLLVMDREVIQMYGYMGTDDLLINILLDPQQIPANFTKLIEPANSFIRFLYNALQINGDHTSLLIYNLNQVPQTKLLFETLIYYAMTNATPVSAREPLLAASLAALPQPAVAHVQELDNSANQIQQIVAFIDQHYQTVTLESLSAAFGYNKNYLGNKLKQSTGLSFTELLDQKRLVTAQNLLLNTNLSLEVITLELGFKNPTSLFRLFNKLVGISPTEFRQTARH